VSLIFSCQFFFVKISSLLLAVLSSAPSLSCCLHSAAVSESV